MMGMQSLRRAICAGTAAVIAAAMLLAGCSSEHAAQDDSAAGTQSAAASTDATEITVEDYTGENITITSTNRIVSLAPAITSILIELGANDRIVGTDSLSRGVEGVTQCGTPSAPDVAAVVALEPDVVFIGLDTGDAAMADLRAAGLAVVDAEAANFEQVPASFTFIGEIVGERQAGEALASQLDGTVAEVMAARPNTSPSCLYVRSLTGDTAQVGGPESLVNAMIEIAGGNCVVNTAGEWTDYSAQQITDADPWCIIYSSSAASYDELVESEVFTGLRAVEGGLVFEIDDVVVMEPGPGLNEGLLALSSIVNEAARGPVETEQTAEPGQEIVD